MISHYVFLSGYSYMPVFDSSEIVMEESLPRNRWKKNCISTEGDKKETTIVNGLASLKREFMILG